LGNVVFEGENERAHEDSENSSSVLTDPCDFRESGQSFLPRRHQLSFLFSDFWFLRIKAGWLPSHGQHFQEPRRNVILVLKCLGEIKLPGGQSYMQAYFPMVRLPVCKLALPKYTET